MKDADAPGAGSSAGLTAAAEPSAHLYMLLLLLLLQEGGDISPGREVEGQRDAGYGTPDAQL